MWEKKPFLFLVLAAVTILAGTIVTMVLPFAWVNTGADRIEGVKPYTPLELAGRDVYIREGCNNCHTQTVRPLVAEVLRYGDYSRSGEFAYDRPFLWGSRRTGPDLARLGGKYPDAWHQKHMEDPRSLVPRSNMPSYPFLHEREIDPEYTRRKMAVLAFPFEEPQIAALKGKSEMDAMVAYLQKLGADLDWRRKTTAAASAPGSNPYLGDSSVIPEGKRLYEEHCASCHGADLTGEIGPDLSDLDMADADLYQIISEGLPEGGMPGYASVGPDRIWKMVTYLKYRKAH